jgi:xanthine dehydrogenase/oxidase
MRYGHNLSLFPGFKMNCLISVYGGDGSVSVAHNGIEMGQGINTKVAQCVAFELGIDVSMVKVKPVTNLTNPNGAITGGSAGSEANCVAAIKACEILKERLSATREKLGKDATWPEIIAAANTAEVDLCARYMFEGKKDDYNGYSVWGVAITEVEVDILTGEMFIVRADITEDAGLSTSPLVDIGQIEGAFGMGLGLWTSEEIKHDPVTGEILTMNTWEYKPPAAKDIPQDFRVTMLKNARNPMGVLSSKATGEPALLLGISVLFAIWDALNSYKVDAGQTGWWQLNGPATVEHIHQHAGVTPDQFTF